ncbi:glycosyltransferase family 4 protein [Caulobacter sp. 73W]|uniref:Glycosyltransferase family 4 protein n=1 Tax=Caulobacter sp. 73W TaxID=3161137 RepID=A0AB39KXK3_9CAUL
MLNICVNGLFRYDQYVRFFGEAGLLEGFYYSHRIHTNAKALGIEKSQAYNLWFKEYALHGYLRINRRASHRSQIAILDAWQFAVLAKYKPAPALLAVIGETADRILTRAKRQGSVTTGHAVTSHPIELKRQISIEHDLLGVAAPSFEVSSRRLDEIALCDRLLVDSSFVARSYSEQGVEFERIATVVPGANMTRFSPRDPAERDTDEFIVMSVGAIVPRKGHRYLLEAWRRAGAPGKLVLVGSLGEHARQILGPYSCLYEHIPRVENVRLRELLVKASVFVLPSVEDGFAQAAMEALACGVPVICTRNAGVADLVVDGVNGWVVDARDPDAIASCIQRLRQDPSLAAQMGVNAGEMAAGTTDWRRYAQEVVELVQSNLK